METMPHSNPKRRASSSFKTKLAASFSRAIKARVKPEVACPGELLTTKHNHDLDRWSFTPSQRGGHSTGSSSLADPVGYAQKGSSHHYYYHHGYGLGNGDENVDSKAESYISNVRERFKLERSDMEQ